MSRRTSAAVGLAGAAPLFAALGDETRLKIVSRLCTEGPLSIVRLTAGTPLSRQAITKHLQALADAGIVRAAGHVGQRQRVWQLAPRRLDEARQHLERLSREWDEALGRLRALVEE